MKNLFLLFIIWGIYYLGIISCHTIKYREETKKILSTTNEILINTSVDYWLAAPTYSEDYTNNNSIFLATNAISENILQITSNNITNIITIRYDGEVIYDTNKVSEATKIFWDYLSSLIKESQATNK